MSLSKLLNKSYTIAIVGLGYVGLPLAAAFSKKVNVIGYDISKNKINTLKNGIDPTQEVGNTALQQCDILYTNDAEEIKRADFIIVAVPTPIKNDHTPDLTPVTSASKIVGQNISKGAIVVFESTVYPGVTEEICVPQIEKYSHLKCGEDFYIGYSPERINPGDKVHRLNNIVKIISGMNNETREKIKQVYALVINKLYEAENIKVAEAAKLIENTQRDINIAFINEVATVFNKLNISTKAVIDAMDTKWNALGFRPGLVGGHCIGIDPYYLVYESEMNNIDTELVSLARKINNNMGPFIGENIIRKLIQEKHAIKNDNIYILGLTFKENCPDMRNSKVIDIINRLREYGITIRAVDPHVNKTEIKNNYDFDIIDSATITDADCLIFAVAHREFSEFTIDTLKAMSKDSFSGNKTVIIDVKNIFNKEHLENAGFAYWGL
ncbi:nucleotide sugar dehydrogenase [Pectinatus frisingensis]|uniref:nucleotide sugar dehydrogenase n=1 Tax=Pectinatus frisingensis TaxID=865 RepID=UPI001E5D06BE|nr:nucleotide sugar dehydrogenase [Pectinatus frisingensis]